MINHWILHEKLPVPHFDLMEWAIWMESADRGVAQTTVKGILVSTVFLGLDHAFRPASPPLLFETMAFNETGDVMGIQERYSTWEEAEAGHQAIVMSLTKTLHGL